jgi:decaprenyl-phosphate phosphoribosyltransferase
VQISRLHPAGNLFLYFEALRPTQWIKNLLVLAAPIAAGSFLAEIERIVLAFVAFVFVSSLGYLVNDWRDRESDTMHLKKRNRSFASGKLTFKHLSVLILLCSIAATATLFFLPLMFIFPLLTYLIFTLLYTFIIKHIPVLEMIWLSAGFLIRALAGSIVINQPPTGWFVTFVFFGALFIVSGKRTAELRNMGSVSTRRVNTAYSDLFLNITSTISLSVTIMTYCLWVFEVHPNSYFAQASILPFTFTILMYLFSSDKGDAESPEKLLFSNNYLIAGIVLTIILLLMVFYS